MKFLYIVYRRKEDAGNETEKVVHQAPIEHSIVKWLLDNTSEERGTDHAGCSEISKEQVAALYDLLTLAHAEKSKESPRPWKYLPIPSEENYPFTIAQYEKEYAAIYYESLYKYITAFGVIAAIFDFHQNSLMFCIR